MWQRHCIKVFAVVNVLTACKLCAAVPAKEDPQCDDVFMSAPQQTKKRWRGRKAAVISFSCIAAVLGISALIVAAIAVQRRREELAQRQERCARQASDTPSQEMVASLGISARDSAQARSDGKDRALSSEAPAVGGRECEKGTGTLESQQSRGAGASDDRPPPRHREEVSVPIADELTRARSI